MKTMIDSISEAKIVLDSDNASEIDSSIQSVESALHSISSKMYQESSHDDPTNDEEDNVVDADFEEVKE